MSLLEPSFAECPGNGGFVVSSTCQCLSLQCHLFSLSVLQFPAYARNYHTERSKAFLFPKEGN